MKSIVAILWKPVAILVIVVLCGYGMCQLFSGKNNQETQVSTLRAYLIDSINSSRLNAENTAIDSAKLEEKKKTYIATQNAVKFRKQVDNMQLKYVVQKKKADSILSVYRSDTTRTNCENAIVALDDQIDTLEVENCQLDSANFYLDQEAESYSQRLYETEIQNKNLKEINTSNKTVIEVQRKEIAVLKKTPNFIEKSIKWVFGVTGLVIGILATR